MKPVRHSHSAVRRFVAAGLIAGAATALSTAAFAGQCPADKVGVNALAGAPTAPQGVSDTVLSHIDLSKEKVKLSDRLFRLRRLEVQPGGIVPMHEHGDRPALIYIISGTILEHSSNCTVPVVHKAGEAAMESVGLSHWWENTGTEPVSLISADIFHDKSDDGQMM